MGIHTTDFYLLGCTQELTTKAQYFYSIVHRHIPKITNSLALLAHAAYETKFGRYMIPGSNSLFMMPATKTWSSSTVLYRVAEGSTTKSKAFRSYPTIGAAIKDYVRCIATSTKWPTLGPALASASPTAYLEELLASGYYPEQCRVELFATYFKLLEAHEKLGAHHGNQPQS